MANRSRTRIVKSLRLLKWPAAALLLALLLWAVREVEVASRITALETRVQAMGGWAFAFCPLLMAACNLLLLPGGVLIAGAGLFFGFGWGVLLVQAGNFLGAAGAFFVSRRFGRGWLERKLLANPRLRAFDEAVNRHGGKIIFFTQLHPASPSSLLNYLFGLTRIRFWPCMGWTLAGQAPGVVLYTYLGTLTHVGIHARENQPGAPSAGPWFWLAGLVAALAITAILGKIARKVLEQARATPVIEPGGNTGEAGEPSSVPPLRPSL